MSSTRGFLAFGPLTLRWVVLVAPPTSFTATKSLPQGTIHSIIDTPGKIVVHVCIQNAQIHRIYLYNMVSTPQMTNKVKTSIGVERVRETIFIGHIVTDEDGSLKFKRVEEFIDSKAELDFTQAVVAGAKRQ